MRYFFSHLNTRLLVLVLIALIPALALLTYDTVKRKQSLYAMMEREAISIARSVAHTQQVTVEKSLELLGFLASLPQMNLECETIWRKIAVYTNRAYDNLGLIQPNGDILCSSHELKKSTNNVSAGLVFQKVKKTLQLSSSYQISIISHTPIFLIITPIFADTREISMMTYVSLRLQTLYDHAKRFDFPINAAFTIVDKNGVVLFHNLDEKKWVGKTYPLATTNVNTVFSEDDGIERLYGVAPLLDTDNAIGAYIFIGLPTELIFNELNKQFINNLLLIGLVVITILLIAHWGGKWLVVRPVQTLLAFTEQLAQGNLTARSGVTQAVGELSQLAIALDKMADALQKRDNAIRQSEIRFRQLVRNSPVVIYSSTPTKNFDTPYISENIKEHLGYTPEEASQPNFWLACVHPTDKEKIVSALDQLFTTGRHRFEYRCLHHDGHYIWLRQEMKLTYDDAGNPSDLVGHLYDITKEKSALLELEQFFNMPSELFLVSNREGYFLHLNPAWTTTLGYSIEELQTQHFSYFIHPDDLPTAQTTANTLDTTNIPMVSIENRYRCKDGNYKWLSWNAIPALEDGYFYAIARDVTTRKQVEEQLRHQKEMLDIILINISDSLIFATRQGDVLLANTEAKKLFGDVKESLFTNDIQKHGLYHSDQTSLLTTEEMPLTRTLCGETLNNVELFIYNQQVPNGIWLMVSGRPIYDETGQVYAGVVIGRDITTRKQTEQALRNSEERLRAILENSLEVVSLADVDTNVEYISSAITTVLGYTPEEFIGKATFDLIHPDDTPVALASMRQLLENPDKIVTQQLRVLHKNGEWRWIEANNSNHLHNPALRNLLTNFHDITERKNAEFALQKEREQLTKRVAERTAELSTANAELARTSRLKDEFLANMSHELRTPLNSILGFSEILKEQEIGVLNPKQLKSITLIEESGRHLLALINDILDVSKISSGHMELELSYIRLKDVCQSSLNFINQQSLKKRQKVSFEIDNQEIKILADGRRLKQILVNLLSNAVKFTPENGELGLIIRSDIEHQCVYLSVWDTGIGIAEDDMPKLFKPFQQIDSSLTRNYEGTGLGLTLVQGMVEMHGGSIHINSTPNQGSRFTIHLPWRLNEASITADLVEKTNNNKHDQLQLNSVLIIEDMNIAADQVKRYVNNIGIASVHILSFGSSAIEVARHLQPDVILLDLVLPDMSGLDVLHHLKNTTQTAKIPVIIVSILDEYKRALTLGASAYLQKPLTRQRLLDVLQSIFTNADFQTARQQPTVPHQTVPTEKLTYQNVPILLAEDNESNIDYLTEYLVPKGFKLTVARNGREALERAKEEKPNIILMDIQMPVMDGLEATRLIRLDTQLSDIPVIALTALAMPGDKERCLAAGATEYLSKPVSLKTLMEVINRFLK
ncbi:PAS domain S-box protein [Beggiatoa leptomitoformis]|uniref:histidine kinase n=1 Tax=Beggiatoa leptomitoformis TaxID=288004 RepID=A0A2N9YEP6_9GAMM|nr:PAS domain S-box protein [Beggiatoa leptomitoformis]AUI68819.1 PAS domain S-box protein [Beggiatoa leptomitoformis]QGX03792.1 PAS domain S-box protein [Beggiatoa leptomitoformis]